MLVLTRKLGERLMIGDNIQLVIVAIEGNKVKLGIDAPKGVRVVRQEIARHIREIEQERQTE